MALFTIAKAVENLAVRLRLGEFEVQPNWKCPSCVASPASPLCADCRASWIYELQDLDYSDAYETRLSCTLGVVGLVTGISGWMANVGLKWYDFGDLIGGITDFLTWFIPANHWLKTPLTILSAATFFVSFLALSSIFIVSGFIMAMNPTGARHWRHMTPQMYTLLGLFTVLEIVAVSFRVSVMDLIVVVGPLLMSGVGFMAPLCMRTPEEVAVIKQSMKTRGSV